MEASFCCCSSLKAPWLKFCVPMAPPRPAPCTSPASTRGPPLPFSDSILIPFAPASLFPSPPALLASWIVPNLFFQTFLGTKLARSPDSVAVKEETLFHQHFAHRGRAERLITQLKKKHFSLHGLHSAVSPFDREKATESFTLNAVPENRDEWLHKNMDYPTLSEAPNSEMTSHENLRSELYNPSLTEESDLVSRPGYNSTPIRTSRAPMGCDGLAGSSSINGEKISAETPSSNLQEHVTDKIPPAEPLLLMRGMELPRYWNAPGGTVVLIDKPPGWTSFSVCEKIRKLVKVKKVGHAGTLDPMSTGLLVVCVGQATKLADRYQALFKVYTGTLRIGEATPSGDTDSPVNEKKPWEHITDRDIQNAKEAFVGEIMQIPPMYSAIKVQGERLYEKARRGEHLDIPPRKVTVYEFQIERNKENRQDLDFRVCCSKGTYVRSLCADLGRALDSCAHMTRLRREKIGDLCARDAWSYLELETTYHKLYRKPLPQV